MGLSEDVEERIRKSWDVILGIYKRFELACSTRDRSMEMKHCLGKVIRDVVLRWT